MNEEFHKVRNAIITQLPDLKFNKRKADRIADAVLKALGKKR